MPAPNQAEEISETSQRTCQASVLKHRYWWKTWHMHPLCYVAKPALRIPLALRHTVALQFQWPSTHQGIENYICEEIKWQKLGPWHCLETYEQLWRSSWSQNFRYVRQHFWEESSEYFHKHLFLRQRPNQRYHLCQVYSWHGTSPPKFTCKSENWNWESDLLSELYDGPHSNPWDTMGACCSTCKTNSKATI